MISIIMAVICAAAFTFAMKMTEVTNGNRYAATFINYLIAIVISIAMMEEKNFFYNAEDGYFALGFAFFNALCMVAGMIFMRKCIGVNGAALATTFYKLGVLIPIILTFFLFAELPTCIQSIGIVIVVITIVYINMDGNENNHINSLALLITVFVIGGMVDFNSKLFNMYGNPELKEYYLFYTFVISSAISLFFILFKDRKISKSDILWGTLTGIPNYYVSYFILRATLLLPAYIVYPIINVCTILVVNIINFFVFKEKLSNRELYATGLIIVALILLNM